MIETKRTRTFAVLGLAFALAGATARAADNRFAAVDTDCKMMWNSATTVEANAATLSVGSCRKKGKKLICTYRTADGQSLGDASEYDILIDDERMLYVQSETGNVKVAFDVQNRRYYYGMVFFAPDKGAMMTKNCVGRMGK